MKVVATMTVWGRPKVFRHVVKHFVENHYVDLVCCLSENDPHYDLNHRTAHEFDLDYVLYKNDPLGEKTNVLLDYVKFVHQPDYIMKVDSDDIIHPSIWEKYNALMRIGVPFFGLTDILMVNAANKAHRLIEYPVVCGAAKMVSTNLLSEIEGSPYTDEINSGLDWSLEQRVYKQFGILPAQVKGVYAMDIKTDTNINSWETMTNRIYAKDIELSMYWSGEIEKIDFA